jgi:hypothetical protein
MRRLLQIAAAAAAVVAVVVVVDIAAAMESLPYFPLRWPGCLS